MASGVAVAAEVSDAFNDLKLKKKFRYVIYRIDDGCKSIIVETYGERGETYEDFAAHFTDDICRYGICDFTYNVPADSNPKNKILFVSWVPDTAKVKLKMLYASSKEAVKKSLKDGIAMEIQASDKSDLEVGALTETFIKKDRCV